MPPQTDASTGDVVSQLDWLKVFAAGADEVLGFSLQSFTETDSTWVPPTACDARVAWEGAYPNGIPIRLEAASFQGKPVYFQVIGEWTRAERERGAERTSADGFRSILTVALLISAAIALYNIRLGRGDRRGATRLALFTFSVNRAVKQ